MASFSVVSCGLATLDIMQYLLTMPRSDQKVVARELLVHAGGPALNAALVAHALGADATLVTGIGSGPIADLVLADLQASGVMVVDRASPLASPPVSTVLVSEATGDRAVISVNATGMEVFQPHPDLLSTDVSAVLVDGHHMAMCQSVAQTASALKIPVLFDGGSWKDGTEALLAHVDCAVISADFALDDVRGPSLAAVADMGPRWIVRTNGAREVEFFDAHANESMWLAVPEVAVLDTLGAGDNFHGAMLAYLGAKGLGANTIRDATTFGARVASMSCRFRGARNWILEEESRGLLNELA